MEARKKNNKNKVGGVMRWRTPLQTRCFNQVVLSSAAVLVDEGSEPFSGRTSGRATFRFLFGAVFVACEWFTAGRELQTGRDGAGTLWILPGCRRGL